MGDFKVYRGLTLPPEEVDGLRFIVTDTKRAKDAFATGDNINFTELLAKEHAPIAQEIRGIKDFLNEGMDKVGNPTTFLGQFTEAIKFAAVSNPDLEEYLEGLLGGLFTAM